MNTASYIHVQLKELVQLEHNNAETKTSIDKAEHLLAYIREQPNYLEVWRDPYLQTGHQLVWFLFVDNNYADAVMVGTTLLGEVETGNTSLEDENLAKLIRLIAAPLVKLGRLDEALSYLHRAYWIVETVAGSVQEVSSIAGSLGLVYSYVNECQKAIRWYEKALQLDTESAWHYGIVVNSNNLVLCYSEMRQYDEAIKYGKQCVATIATVEQMEDSVRETVHRRIYVTFGYVHNNLGKAWLAKGDLVQAQQYYERGLAISDDNDSVIGRLYALRGLGEIAIKQRGYSAALEYLDRSLEIAEQLNTPKEICLCCERLAEAYSLDGNYALAFQYQRRYHDAYKVVYDEQKQRSLEQFEVKHRTEIAQMEATQMRIKNEALEQLVKERVINLQESLERESKLSTQLQDALRVTEQINTVRSEMINMIAHEFRTPLTVIHTSSKLLEKHYDHFPQERRNQHFMNIKESVFNLEGMLQNAIQIDQFKFVSAMTAETHIPFSMLCTEVESALIAEHPSRLHISFDGSVKQTVEIDVALLMQGMMPLVDNALTYSDDDIKVNIKLDLGKMLKVTIEDRGMGITAEEMPHIFDLFYRSTRAQFLRGLGLGLYTARHVVQLLGGEIMADSDGTDKGAKFVVTV